MKTIITFIIVFGILVLVHEFGHFYFAKRAGILVREFAIGMGPKILRIVEKMAPFYTIRLLPIGGYVRMAGMGEDMTEITPGMPLSVELNAVGNVVKINTSKKYNYLIVFRWKSLILILKRIIHQGLCQWKRGRRNCL